MTTYGKDADQNEMYARNSAGVEVVEHQRYAEDKEGRPFYPRDASKNEFLDEQIGLIERGGEYVYPLRADGKPNYRKESGGGGQRKEVYEDEGGKWILGRGSSGDQWYAKNEHGHEYYPPGNALARKLDGSPVYAQTAAGATVFPRDAQNNEYYIALVDPLRAHTVPTKYAVGSGGDETYPKTKTWDGQESEYILRNAYAKRGGDAYYPRDGSNNEFYLERGSGAEKLLAAYAATNDGKVILPHVNNVPHMDAAKQPQVTLDHVLGRLFREQYQLSKDYLTSVDAATKPAVSPRRYSYMDKTTSITIQVVPPGSPAAGKAASAAASAGGGAATRFYQTWYFWILMVFLLIAKSFAVWWFFMRSRMGYSRI